MPTPPTPASRRTFLQDAGLTLAATGALAGGATSGRTMAAADRLRIALVGCGGRGVGVAGEFRALPGCKVVAVCDPDAGRLDAARSRLEVGRGEADLRRILDDDRIDAVIVATPDHWHAPAAILALAAGKHVYVEKPCSHNVREGRLLVEAAARSGRVVQHGTQSRSNPFIAGGVQLLREGIIGDVLVAKAWNVQRRDNIGHTQPSAPPAGFDYDLWVGPAEMTSFRTNCHHYTWHWWHNFGTGDAGNDGVHELDLARWGLGVETHPTRITGSGTKLYFDDDQEFPDTQTVVFDYPGDGVGTARQLLWEMRIWSTTYPSNVDNAVEFYGTKGKMLLSKRGKLEVRDERNKVIENPQPVTPPPLAATNHAQDFVDAIRQSRPPQADIAAGHLSASLAHLANLATRVGRSLTFDPATESIAGDAEAQALLGRKYRDGGHWAVPG